MKWSGNPKERYHETKKAAGEGRAGKSEEKEDPAFMYGGGKGGEFIACRGEDIVRSEHQKGICHAIVGH